MIPFTIAALERIIKCQSGSHQPFFSFHITIDIGGTPHCQHAAVVVDMTEDVKSRADALYGLQEVTTAMADPSILVHDAAGRDVGDEDIGVCRNQSPFFAYGLAPGQGKGITGRRVENRLPGGSVELDPCNAHCFILEIDGIRQQLATELRGLGQEMIMIAGDDDFVAMGQGFEKGVEAGHILNRPAHGHVSGKDEDVGLWNFHLPMEHVGVTESSYFHGDRGVAQGWISSMERMSQASVLALLSGLLTTLNSKMLLGSRKRVSEVTLDLEQ